MSYAEEYSKKIVSADEAVKVVKSGDWVDFGWCVNTPEALDVALAKEQMILRMLSFAAVSLQSLLLCWIARMPSSTLPGTPGIWEDMRESFAQRA